MNLNKQRALRMGYYVLTGGMIAITTLTAWWYFNRLMWAAMSMDLGGLLVAALVTICTALVWTVDGHKSAGRPGHRSNDS